jgi:hypothetical protein
MIKKTLTGLLMIVSSGSISGCKTTIPVSTTPTADNCIKITVETNTQTKTFYYCDSANVNTAEFILKYLKVK